MAEKAKAPSIRFKGFTDAWEQRNLSKISTKVTEKNASTTYSETFTNSAEFGIISQRDFFDHDITNIDNLNGYYIVKNEDFVYNPRISTFAPVGPINRNKLGRNGVMSPLYTVFRSHDIDNTFLEQYFKSRYWHTFMKLNGDSGARSDRFSIKDSVFVEMPIPYPELHEQKKIGIYLTHLDNLITLHQSKLLKLKNINKAMLEKMFPKNGNNVPEIRFEGFTDAWEQRKVGEVTEELDQYTTFQSGFPLLTSSRSGLMMQNEYRDNTSTDNQDTLFSIVPMGACTYRHMSDDDVFHFNINEIAKNGLVSREYPVFTASKGNNLFAVIQYLNSSTRFRAFCREQKMGGTRTRLYYKSLCKFELLLPSEKEQDQIAAVLKKLDNLITLHQRKLEKLQNIKKASLEKMFV